MWAGETDQDRELAALKRVKLNLDSALANEQNSVIRLTTELSELKTAHKEEVYKALLEAEKRAKAEELLRKKTEELKLCEVQRANAQQAASSAESKLKDEASENKRLNYEIEVLCSQSASTTSNNAQTSRLQDEKAALERKVLKLSKDLKDAQLQQRENIPPSAASSPSSFAKEAKSKITNLEGQIFTLQADNARLQQLQTKTSSSSRSSISPADAPQAQRNRFGFASQGPSGPRPSLLPLPEIVAGTPARPSSSLGTRLPVPATNRRRSSSLAVLPPPVALSSSSSNNSSQQNLAQLSARITTLTSDLSSAESTLEIAKKDLSTSQQKLQLKERSLLQVENQLLALEKTKTTETEVLKSKLEDSREELAEHVFQINSIKEGLKTDYEKTLKQLRDANSNIESKVERLEIEMGKKEKEIQSLEARREDIEIELHGMRRTEVELKSKFNKTLEDVYAEKKDLERQLEKERASLKEEMGKESTRQNLEMELQNLRTQLINQSDKATKSIELAKSEAAQYEGELIRLKEDLKTAQTQSSNYENLQLELFEKSDALAKAELGVSEAGKTALELRERLAELEKEQLQAKEDLQSSTLHEHPELVSESAAKILELEQNLATIEQELASSKEELQAKMKLEGDVAQLHESLAHSRELVELLETSQKASAAEKCELTEQMDSLKQLCKTLQADTEERVLIAKNSRAKKDLVTKNQVVLLLVLHHVQQEHSLALLECDRLDELIAPHQQEILQQQQHFSKLLLTANETSLQKDADLDRSANKIIELEQTLQKLNTRRPAYDNVDYAQLSDRLADSITSLRMLEEKTSELEILQWGTLQAKENSNKDVALLQERLQELTKELEESRFLITQRAVNSEDLLADLQSQLLAAKNSVVDLEERLSISVAAEKALDHQNLSLESDLFDSRMSVESLNRNLQISQDELELLRTTSLTASDSAMAEIGDLQSRILEQTEGAQRLDLEMKEKMKAGAQKVMEQHTKDATKLREEIEHVLLAAKSQNGDMELKLKQADDRIVQLESEVVLSAQTANRRLDSEEDQSTSPHLNGQDIEILTASPASKETCDHTSMVTLISRLREEREGYKVRLDFSRQEARCRFEALERQLQGVEESKAHELSALQVLIIEKTDIIDSLRQAEQSANELCLKETQLKIELREAQDRNGDLEAATLQVEQLQAERETMRVTIKELTEDLVQATKSVEHFKIGALRNQNANRDLHIAFATSMLKSRLDASTVHALRVKVVTLEKRSELNDFELPSDEQKKSDHESYATSINLLQEEVKMLRAKLNRRTEQIGTQAQKIITLEAQLEILNAEEGDRSAELSMATIDTSRLEDDLAEKTAELAREKNLRGGLEDDIVRLTTQLEESKSVNASEKVAGQYNELKSKYEKLSSQLESALGRANESECRSELLESQIAVLTETQSRLQTQIVDENSGRTRLEQEIKLLNSEVTTLRETLTITRQALEESLVSADSVSQDLHLAKEEVLKLQAAARGSREEQDIRIIALEAELNSLLTKLSDAQQEVHSLTEKINEIDKEKEEHTRTAAKLQEADSHVNELIGLLQTEHDVNTKQRAASEALSREIQTLRSLGKTATADLARAKKDSSILEEHLLQAREEAEALKHDKAMLENKTEEISERSTRHLTEVIDHVEKLEVEKAKLEEKIVGLERQIVSTHAAATEEEAANAKAALFVADAKVKDLEQVLLKKSAEAEETDEKYIEVLRTQKRYLAQIERLKVKIESLQRDLLLAKSTAAAAPVVAEPKKSTPLASLSKKRERPVEFDRTTTVITPRAIVSSQRQRAEPLQGKENDVETSQPTHSLVKLPADGIVPLKPEGKGSIMTDAKEVRRPALSARASNVSVAAGVPYLPVATGNKSEKLASLQARLAQYNQRRGVLGGSAE